MGGKAMNEGKVDKTMVKRRLLWITEEEDRAIPSRATMTRVHGYLIRGQRREKEAHEE